MNRFDQQMIIVKAKMPDEFTAKVNELLQEGHWRVEQTEMSVTDHHYFAMLVKAIPDGTMSGLPGALRANGKGE